MARSGGASADNARLWYRRAIEGGDRSAHLGLGSLLLETAKERQRLCRGAPQFEAVPIGNDYAEARWQLGLMRLIGLGQPVDAKAAVDEFTRAAERGDTRAMSMVASLYEGDLLGDPDPAKAKEWYVKAAGAADGGAMFRLAAMAVERFPDPEAEKEAALWMERGLGSGCPKQSYRCGGASLRHWCAQG